MAVESSPREARTFNGRNYVMEEAITADFSLIKGWRADRAGNVQFRKVEFKLNLAHCLSEPRVE